MFANIPYRLVFALCGISQLVPWNVITKSLPSILTRLKETAYEKTASSLILTAFTAANFAALLVLVLADFRFLKIKLKIAVGLLGSCIVLLGTAVAGSQVRPDDKGVFFGVTLGGALLSGCFMSFMMNGFLGMIARFPREYTPNLLFGQAFGGLAFSLTNNLLASIFDDGGAKNIFWLHSIGSSITFLTCIIFVSCLMYSRFFKRYLCSVEDVKRDSRNSQGNSQAKTASAINTSPISKIKIGKGIVWFLTGIFLTLFITLKGIVMFISKSQSRIFKVGGATALLFYDLGDLTGRFLPSLSLFKFGHSAPLVIYLPWVRIAFIPTFFAIARIFKGTSEKHLLLEYGQMFVCFCFGLTNGYAITLLLMNAPSRTQSIAEKESCSADCDSLPSPNSTVTDSNNNSSDSVLDESMVAKQVLILKKREISGTLMALFLNLGLLLGSLSSLLFSSLQKSK